MGKSLVCYTGWPGLELYSLGIEPTQKLSYVISAEVHRSTDAIAGSLARQQAAFCSPEHSWEYVGFFLKGGRVLVLLSKSEWGSWTRSAQPS